MDIRRLQIDDVDKLVDVFDIFSFKEAQKSNAQKFLGNPLNYFLIAQVNDNIPGYLLGYELQKPETEKSKFFIYDIEVLEKYRRQGIGKALIEKFKSICLEHNGSEVFVPTNKSNLPAMKLYESTGGKLEKDDDAIFVYT